MAERLPRDFGLARATDAAGSSTPGTLIGTVAYMSPEQVEGLEATEAFDLYALGAVAYQLLTGRVPFEGSIDTVCMKIRNEEPAPLARALRPDGATPAVTPATPGVTLSAAPEAVSMAWSTDSIVVQVNVSASSDIFLDDIRVASAATHWI